MFSLRLLFQYLLTLVLKTADEVGLTGTISQRERIAALKCAVYLNMAVHSLLHPPAPLFDCGYAVNMSIRQVYCVLSAVLLCCPLSTAVYRSTLCSDVLWCVTAAC